MSPLGIIIIGRNEGDRLLRCLRSALDGGHPLVYVDSGSTDASLQHAQALGAHCVELDLSTPFSAARARNEGFQRLLQIAPDVQFVQFIDGDCELCPGWLDAAARLLGQRPEVAAVAGRLRERFPNASIYNRLCQIEWDGPAGDVEACGGIAMMRAQAFQQAGGFNPAIIAGEEPELCVRFRQAGLRIHRLEHDMAWHDAAITRFSQWFKRAQRSGHAYAQGAFLHGRSPQRHWLRQSRSIWFWALGLPLLALALAWPTNALSLLLLAAYPLLLFRIFRSMKRRGYPASDAALYAAFCLLAKFPQALGQLRFHCRRLRHSPLTLIEYKQPPTSSLSLPGRGSG